MNINYGAYSSLDRAPSMGDPIYCMGGEYSNEVINIRSASKAPVCSDQSPLHRTSSVQYILFIVTVNRLSHFMVVTTLRTRLTQHLTV